MWVYLTIIGMILGTGYWVCYPLLKPRKFDSPGEPPSEDSLGDLKREKEEIYSAIKEMELDHKMGKLSEDDYLNLREKYRAKAVGTLKRMDELEGREVFSEDIEDEIEKEVSALRREDRKVTPARGEPVFCTQCGKKRSLEDRFCSWCGAELAKP
jgi:hypothetical protein